MKKIIIVFLILFFISGCESQIENNPNVNYTNQDENTPPVETQEPHTTYEPSVPNQTRAPGVKTQTELKTEVVITGLNAPWSVKELPSGDFLITEKSGHLKLITPEGELRKIETDFKMVNSAGQGGLLDVLVDPDFENNRLLYFTLSLNHTAVLRARLTDDNQALEAMEIIYEALPSINSVNHYGSRIVMDDARNLYVSTGDRQNVENRYRAQELDNGHGKVIRINPDLTAEVFAYGFRNPQGLVFDSQKNLYLSDMGPMGGDELNLVTENGNYGWSLISYGLEYSGAPINEGEITLEGTVQPLYYWDPSIAPSGIDVYESDLVEEWQGNLFVASLVQRHLVRLVLKESQVVGEERLFEDLGLRIRDVHVASDGSVLVISDEGQLIRIGR